MSQVLGCSWQRLQGEEPKIILPQTQFFVHNHWRIHTFKSRNYLFAALMKSTHFLLAKSTLNLSQALPQWRIATVDGQRARTLPGFYEQIAQALAFPDDFDHNLDALDELLNDLEWIEEEKVALYISHTADWLSGEKSDEKKLMIIDLLEATAEDWKWLDDDEEAPQKEFRIIFEDTPRIRTLLEEQEIPFGTLE